jgi:hypothetical protein
LSSSHFARNAAIASSRVAAKPDRPSPNLSVRVHAVDAPDDFVAVDHVEVVQAGAAEGKGHVAAQNVHARQTGQHSARNGRALAIRRAGGQAADCGVRNVE